MTTKKSQSHKTSNAFAVGAGIAALAATAAGAYYLYGTDKGKKNRKAMKSWTLKMKADVMDEIEQLKELNEEMYAAAVTKIAKKYKQIKDIDPAEVMALAKRMQGHWKDIKKDLSAGVKTVKKIGRAAKK